LDIGIEIRTNHYRKRRGSNAITKNVKARVVKNVTGREKVGVGREVDFFEKRH